MTTTRVSLTVPAEPEMVMLARAAAASLAAMTTWLPVARVDDVRLAVSEAVTNAVLAQRRVDPAAILGVEVIADAERFDVVITDAAGGFDPHPHDDIAVAPHREGGRGLAIMRRFVDELRFTQTDAGTVVELRFLRHRSV